MEVLVKLRKKVKPNEYDSVVRAYEIGTTNELGVDTQLELGGGRAQHVVVHSLAA